MAEGSRDVGTRLPSRPGCTSRSPLLLGLFGSEQGVWMLGVRPLKSSRPTTHPLTLCTRCPIHQTGSRRSHPSRRRGPQNPPIGVDDGRGGIAGIRLPYLYFLPFFPVGQDSATGQRRYEQARDPELARKWAEERGIEPPPLPRASAGEHKTRRPPPKRGPITGLVPRRRRV